MVKLLKYFNYISYHNKILLLNKHILKHNYYFILFPHFNLKTMRLNYLIKFNLLKYGLKFSFFTDINFLPFKFSNNLNVKNSSVIYTKNIFKFITFFKKIFLFISQQEEFIFRLGVYVKIMNNFFTYTDFHVFLKSVDFINLTRDWKFFYKYIYIYMLNSILIKRNFFFIFFNNYFLFWFFIKSNLSSIIYKLYFN